MPEVFPVVSNDARGERFVSKQIEASAATFLQSVAVSKKKNLGFHSIVKKKKLRLPLCQATMLQENINSHNTRDSDRYGF